MIAIPPDLESVIAARSNQPSAKSKEIVATLTESCSNMSQTKVDQRSHGEFCENGVL